MKLWLTVCAAVVVGLLFLAWIGRDRSGGLPLRPEGVPPPEESSHARTGVSQEDRHVVDEPESGEAARSTLCVVFDSNREPIAGAQVSLSSEDTLAQLGVTSSLGTLELLLEPGEQRALLVTAVGFANELYPVPDPPPQRVEIMLVRDAVIAGIVLNEAGEPAGAGIHVLAYRYSTSQPTPAVVVAAMNGEETECHAALTGVDGAYELHGLKPDRKYGLLCGGNGRMLRFDGFPTEIVQAGTTDATLIVHPLYGALVRLALQ